MKMNQIAISLLAVIATSALGNETWTADDLGQDLTRFGAIAAGNEAGTIPAYTGGLEVPASLKPAGGSWPNPFADEEPLFRISAENADEFADQLSAGQMKLLKQYPDTYYMDIYPTHRTAAFPEPFLAATVNNAGNPDCQSLHDGLSVSEACRGGLPFPIPQSGEQAMWNYLLNYQGINGWDWNHSAYVVNQGRVTLTNTNRSTGEKPFYQLDVEGRDPKIASRIWSRIVAPARTAGTASGYWDHLDPVENDRYAWSYSTGQRRIRKAPEFSYDTPNAAFGSVSFYDEIFLFSGKMDRFSWTLEGKREMFLPYSNYELKWGCDMDTKLMENHINPACERWELHRAWVVSAERKEGVRHAQKSRRYYIDEDTFGAALYDAWDDSGEMFRSGAQYNIQAYGIPNNPQQDSYSLYDFTRSQYGMFGNGPTRYREAPIMEREANPQTIAAGQSR
ncbi:DUF1329 domain-containing protein [Halopseudomonas pelagia]|uniref:DUF1329 domain-containing protein n=1 Tax=Halopseudomonas pelagia TaxID=553151 RepID=A0AA91U2K7_9GAMM|nr:DUF1329 domain-containing protein [Halopseudomonas pelagia]PCC99560.1 hypothetical protein CO192_10045 [Halopseudomonas pelagia]QFY56501.1 DUF1329 domain-containing protein [Halopseudomonas pelagia]